MADTRDPSLDNLDMLVTELHRHSPAGSASDEDARTLAAWLGQVRAMDGSDLLLVAGLPPTVRVKGAASPLPGQPLTAEDIERVVSTIVPFRLRKRYRAGEAIDLNVSCVLTEESPTLAEEEDRNQREDDDRDQCVPLEEEFDDLIRRQT